jgi:polyadenylate-binding protein
LNDTFSDYGTILSCKVATDDAGQSKGYAFIQFQNQDDADKVVKAVNGQMIEGQAVFVGPFKPLSERRKTGEEPKFTNIFIKNLEKEVTQAQVEEKFGTFGEITSAKLPVDDAGASKCFAFVNFKDPEAAKKAIEETNGKVMFGTNELTVCRHQSAAQRQAALKKAFEERRLEMMRKYQGNNLFVKNLDDEVDEDKLREVFGEFGTVTSAKVEMEGGKSKGFGYVCFTDSDSAQRAVTDMNGKMVGNKPIFVALHQSKEIRRAQLQSLNLQRQFTAQGQGMRPFPQQPGMMMYPPQRPGQLFMYPPPGPMGPGRGYNMGPRPGMQVPNGGRGGQRYPRGGGRGQAAVPAGRGQQGQQVQFKNNVRNQRDQGVAMPMAQAQVPVQQVPVQPGQLSKEQLASLLVTATPEQQKQLLGERLYALISTSQGPLTGKITGMLLEGLDNGELLHLIDSPEALEAKIGEALAALQSHEGGAQ